MNITTHPELVSAIYNSTSFDVLPPTTSPEGDVTFRNDATDKFFIIKDEYEDDGQTFWGWTWSTGVYADGDGEIMEYFSTDGGQDAAEPLAEAIRHLGAIEDNR